MNSSLSFYWHDYETWGTSPKWDRPSQFAGIRTDWNLEVIGEPLVSYCRPSADVLPHPEACLITGITPQHAYENGICEADFFREIHQQFIQPGTCGAGYNSLRFDDEFTRYGFYRNFYDPYAREWQNGNSRWDLIDVVRLTRALRPEGIEWPEKEPGVTSFRLELLTQANGIAHEAAHDALSDVMATIAMARLIREKQPRLYEWCLKLRLKSEAARLLNVQQPQPVLHISRMIPARLGCISVFLPLVVHPVNKNSVICYDLRYAPDNLINAGADELASRLFARSGDLPDGVERIALKEVHLNKTPVLSPMNTLSDAAASEWQIDRQQIQDNVNRLLDALKNGLGEKVVSLYSSHAFEPETDPDNMLYEGFIERHDRQLCDQVLETPADQLGQLNLPFRDPRLPELLFRYRARNWPEFLNGNEQDRWQQFCKDHLADKQGKRGFNLDSYRQLLAKMSIDMSLTDKQRKIVDSLLDWPVFFDGKGIANV